MVKDTRLLIVGTYPPPFGGIATHLVSLIPYLHKNGVADIAVVSFKNDEGIEKKDGFILYNYNVKKQRSRLFDPRNWPLFVISYVSLKRYQLPFRTIIIEAIKAILVDSIAKKHNSNVVSFYQSNLHFEIVPLSAYWKTSKAIVLTVFGEFYENTKLLYKHKSLFQRILSIPQHVASSSRHCANSFKKIGVERVIEPVYYGVNLENVISLEMRERFRQEHAFEQNDIVLLFMGRFSEEMGFHCVLNVASELLLVDQRIKFVFAGQKAELTERAAELSQTSNGRVVILQNVPFSKQNEIFNGADILLAPTFNQRACMGMAIKEAMAASLPVIGSNGGGISEAIVNNETGYLIDLDEKGDVDQDQFLEKIKELCEIETKRRAFGKAGRVRAEDIFSVERTNRRMLEIFTSSLEKL